MTETIKIFIGFDQVESVAYHVLCQSILEHATMPVAFIPIKQSLLKDIYKRPTDPKQSNEFSFTRFLVPYLCNYTGKAIFLDLDQMLRTDIKQLWQHSSLRFKAVSVAQHNYIPKDSVKYLGAAQYPYPRKNWSSVMLFNCSHSDCRKLTPEYINNAPALNLHRFNWARDGMIGDLSLEWNHLVGEYPYSVYTKLVHFTVGGPYFNEYKDCDYSDEWRDYHKAMTNCLQIFDENGRFIEDSDPVSER